MDLDDNNSDTLLATPSDPTDGLPDLDRESQAARGQNAGLTDSPSASGPALTVPGLDASLAPTSRVNPPTKVFLHDIPTSKRYFWKESIVEQLALEMADKYPEQTTRPMSKHEILVMALNEIAVHYGYGFFFHLPSKGGQRKTPNDEVCPRSRVPPSTRLDLPNIYFMKRVWTAEAQQFFFGSGHRTRYLLCDGLLGMPDDDTPLYAIQHVFYTRATSFLTLPPSLVVFANESAFYLASTEHLKRLIGAQCTAHSADGSDQGVKLNKTPYLWDNSPSEDFQEFAQLIVTNAEEIYHRVRQDCTHPRLRPTFSALD